MNTIFRMFCSNQLETYPRGWGKHYKHLLSNTTDNSVVFRKVFWFEKMQHLLNDLALHLEPISICSLVVISNFQKDNSFFTYGTYIESNSYLTGIKFQNLYQTFEDSEKKLRVSSFHFMFNIPLLSCLDFFKRARSCTLLNRIGVIKITKMLYLKQWEFSKPE